MAQFTRSNAWNKGGTFDNPDLLWYAMGVREMQNRGLSDPHSWWFFAAIHGEYVTPDSVSAADEGTLLWKDVPAPPAVPVSPLPTSSDAGKYWNQCQHQSWFFLPWHRGYLLALEAHIRDAVVSLQGPSDWSLPYWNYLGDGDEYKIPPAFTEQTLPDGSPNPLFVSARYGPDQDRSIYVPTHASIKGNPNHPELVRNAITDDCLKGDLFAGSDVRTKAPGFGGPETTFWHGGGTSGNLESDPHNNVHVFVGNSLPDGSEGLMSDPGLAALDPIFYLHHANIDRMWAVWNESLSRENPTEDNWLSGPPADGDGTFVMPMPDGKSWQYSPSDVSSLRQVNYSYDVLEAPPQADVAAEALLAARFEALGAPGIAAKLKEGAPMALGRKTELVGASETSLTLNRTGVATAVRLHPAVRQAVNDNLTKARQAAEGAAQINVPDRIYLNLENVRGRFNSSVLNVYIDLPDGAMPGDHPERFAGSVGLFGLRRASQESGKHGGGGLNFILDITPIVDRMHLTNSLNLDSLAVRIVPDRPIPDSARITIGRISIYREGQ